MQVINGYSLAGAEKVAFDLAAGLDKEKFDLLVCGIGCLKDGTDEAICGKLRGMGVKTLVLGKPPRRRRIETVRKLCGLLRENHVNIVHTHCQSPDFYGKLSAFLAGTPLVFSTIHNVRGYHAAHERILPINKYVATSETVKQYAISDLKIPLHRSISAMRSMSTNCTDNGRQKRKLRQLAPGKENCCYMGTVQERKGTYR
jgi:hypothetical protein